MKNDWLIPSILIALLLAGPIAMAAPDAAPSLEWDTVLMGNDPQPCTTERNTVGITTDLSGNVYSLETCQTTGIANQDLLVIKTSSSGAQVWAKTINCDVQQCLPYGISAGSDGMVGVAFYDQASSLAVKMRFFVFRQSNGNVVCDTGGQGVTFPNGFTNNIGSPTNGNSVVSYKNFNGTTIYGIGGPNGVAAVLHYAINGCRQLWVSTTTRADESLAYNRRTHLLAGMMSSPSDQFALINGTTGVQVAVTSIGGTQYSNYVRGNTTDRVWTVKDSANDNEFKEFNSTTGILVRTVTPIESHLVIPSSTDDMTINRGGFWMDGANSIFVCGQYFDNTLGAVRPAIAKYNSTQKSGMRWNVTFGSPSGAQGERAASCEIASGGALYAIWRIAAATNEVHVRKYSNAGIPNIKDAPYTLFGDNSTTPSNVGNGDAATGFKNFCLFNGFTSSASKFFCGLVYVMSGTFLVGAIAQRVTDRKATMISAGIAALCLMIFVVLIELWDSGTTVLLIILASAFIVWVARNMFIQRGTG